MPSFDFLLFDLAISAIVFVLIVCVCVSLSVNLQEESQSSGLKDQQVLGVWGHCKLFQHSVETLRSQLWEKGEGAELVWDKVWREWSPFADKFKRNCDE